MHGMGVQTTRQQRKEGRFIVTSVDRISLSKSTSRDTSGRKLSIVCRQLPRRFWVLRIGNIAIAIGISSGTFLAIATADILPQVHRIEERNPLTLVFLVLGLAVSWIGRLLAH